MKPVPSLAISRRNLLAMAGASAATTLLAQSVVYSAEDENPQPIVASPTRPNHTSFPSMNQVAAGVLNVGYAEAGPDNGRAVVLLHGWPYDVLSYVDVAPLLAEKRYRVIVPYLRGYGTTRFLSSTTVRNGEQAAIAVDIIALLDALKIEKAIFAGYDWGARTAVIIAALWPERCKALVAVSGYIITNLKAQQLPLQPQAELGWWYQYYFSTERGRRGYDENRYAFNKLIWKLASPKWNFDDATYDRTATSFNNPDHVDIVIHNYRWRLGLAVGESKYQSLENKLQTAPLISVPSITIGSDFDGAAADGAGYRKQFAGKYLHRTLSGIGHNVPQEAPSIFANAIVDVDALSS
jgi:pimeloyl-ACP methyl ester carboxylesterase